MKAQTTALIACCIALLLALPFCAHAAADDIIGAWECLDKDAGQFINIEFGEDGVFYIDMFKVEYGRYKINEKRHQVAVIENGRDEQTWVAYEFIEGALALAEGSERVLFDPVDAPSEPANELVGRWSMQEQVYEDEVIVPAGGLFFEFGNDMSFMLAELDETLEGTYFIDPRTGTFTGTVEGDEQSGNYEIAGDTLSLTVDGETKVFDRVI
ncbi:hypothetical protein JW859_09320 [bacterium]|nr:hypothetical protein [bacterium]